MNWIRSPAYDCFWILSAPALGLAMVFWPWPAAPLLMINFAHAISPIGLAWSHSGFRAVMLAKPRKFIGVPLLLIAVGLAVAMATSWYFPQFVPRHLSLENVTLDKLAVPIVIWANVYAVWNLYHAGAQNFGIWCLYRRQGYKPGWRKYALLGGSVAAVVLIGHETPRWLPYTSVALFALGLTSGNHWLAAIGLCGHVYARHTGRSPWWFIAAALLLGLSLSTAFILGVRWGILWLAVLSFCLRGWLGMWHFLQDRWLWKLSDPQVRATIGRDLFV